MHTSIASVSRTALVLSLFAACGGKSSPATTTSGGGAAGGGAPAVGPAPGIHGCTFTSDGYAFGPHRCDVLAGDPVRVEKLSGMELFSGTLAASGAGATLTATGTCEPRTDTCGTSFTVELAREGDAWRGQVVAQEGSDWWLNGATFEITDAAGYGGAGYGGDGYGGYGGDGYGGAMYGGGE